MERRPNAALMDHSPHRRLIALVLATLLALYAHAHWMSRSVRLDSLPGAKESAVDDRPEGGKSVARLAVAGGTRTLDCDIAPGYAWPFCELDIKVDARGIDLRDFDSLRLALRNSGPGKSGAVRVFLRNANPAYTTGAGDADLKPHEVVYEPSAYAGPVEFKLSQFMVSSWWTQSHPSRAELLGPQLDHVTTIAFTTGGDVVPGHYTIVVESAELRGLWISSANFRLGIILVWLVCIVGHLALVWRRARLALKDSIEQGDALHSDNEALEARVQERTQALALSNSRLIETLQNLDRARTDLVQSEKNAALGALVAGVAHELNTPLGNAVMAASTIGDMAQRFRSQLGKTLTRSALDGFVGDMINGTDILNHNLTRAAGLVTSFKQLAADQHSGQRRRFDLRAVLDETAMAIAPALRKGGHKLELDVAAGFACDSYPGPLSQVVINLINNAIMHGFDGRSGGRILVEARALGADRVALRVADDGIGMPAQVQAHVFEPFFTTKLGQGGSGLGMHLVYNIATQVLGGKVELSSRPGAGTSVCIELPLRAPAAESERARIGVPDDVADDYARLLDGRAVADLAHFGGPHSRRDVAELALFLRAMARALPHVEIDLVRIDSYARGIEQLRSGAIAALGTSSWQADLLAHQSELILSKGIVADGQAIVGLYTRAGNAQALAVRTLEDLRALRIASNSDWSADWQTLEALGAPRRVDVKTWRQMVYMVSNGEADLLLAPFPCSDKLDIDCDGCVLVPVHGHAVALRGSRHYAAARSKIGLAIVDAVFPDIAALVADGGVERAFTEAGFLGGPTAGWARIGPRG